MVVEVVSTDAAGRARDYDDKRRDYAAAGIPEYWIVDPAERRVLVLNLDGDKYSISAECGIGDWAESKILKGFCVSVERLIRAGEVSPTA